MTFWVGLQKVLGDVQALVPVEARRLAGDELHLVLGVNRLLKTFAPVTGRARAGDAFELNHVAATDELDQLFSRHLPALHVIRGDQGGYLAARSAPVEGENGDVRLVGGLYRRPHGLRINRVYQDGVELLGDEVLDVVLLLGGVVLGVGDLQRRAGVVRRLLGTVPQADEERVAERGNRERQLGTAVSTTGTALVSATAATSSRQHEQRQSRQ